MYERNMKEHDSGVMTERGIKKEKEKVMNYIWVATGQQEGLGNSSIELLLLRGRRRVGGVFGQAQGIDGGGLRARNTIGCRRDRHVGGYAIVRRLARLRGRTIGQVGKRGTSNQYEKVE